MLLAAQNGDVLQAPTTNLGNGMFVDNGKGGFSFVGESQLYQYQGYGPYNLIRKIGENQTVMMTITLHPVCDDHNCPLDEIDDNEVEQPIYDYSSGIPVYTGFNRVVSYEHTGTTINPASGDSIPWLLGGPVGAYLLKGIPGLGTVIMIFSAATAINNSIEIHLALAVSYQDKNTYIGSPNMATHTSRRPPDWMTQPDIR